MLTPTHVNLFSLVIPLVNRDTITLPDELLRRVDGLNDLFRNVVAPREACIDSEGIRVLSAIGREQVESTQGEVVQFDSTVFAEKLVSLPPPSESSSSPPCLFLHQVTFMGGRRGAGDEVDFHMLNWELLGEKASTVFRRVCTPSFL